VAKGMTDEVWWQSDLNWRQEIVHKHRLPIHLDTAAGDENITSRHIRCGRLQSIWTSEKTRSLIVDIQSAYRVLLRLAVVTPLALQLMKTLSLPRLGLKRR